MSKILLLFLTALIIVPCQADELAVALSSDGVAITAPNLGHFVLAPPIMQMTAQDFTGQKPNVTFEDDSTLLAKYPNGLEIRIKVDPATKTAQYTLSAPPAGAYALRCDMLIPTNLQAKCGFDRDAMINLPGTSQDQFVLKGQNAGQFNLANGSGAGFSLIAPNSWQDLQDNRKFNWDTFQYHYFYDLARYPDQTHFEIHFEALASAP